MHAVILDIDGTLIQSDDVDANLYIAAVQSVLGTITVRDSWEKYAHVTDSGILEDICNDNGLLLTGSILDQVRVHLVAGLSKYIGDFGPFQEIPGARDFVVSLLNSDNHQVAYATGGWSASAKLKLASAGFPLSIPMASSDDFSDRTAIMTHALGQIGREFDSISYYGDGFWDRLATDRLGWRFVAVGTALAGLTRYEALYA